ncbi:hypothetical protein ACFQHO_30815 [Actinomadura yumaensis]|uniref:ATP dependent DNA ligase n=1 Tax=Actinomadura yumaensis TaxID=111807 RepID=UPI0036142F63
MAAAPRGQPVRRGGAEEFARDAQWVEPLLVGDVAYSARTRDGRLRFPSWRGRRDDKDPHEVIREP